MVGSIAAGRQSFAVLPPPCGLGAPHGSVIPRRSYAKPARQGSPPTQSEAFVVRPARGETFLGLLAIPRISILVATSARRWHRRTQPIRPPLIREALSPCGHPTIQVGAESTPKEAKEGLGSLFRGLRSC